MQTVNRSVRETGNGQRERKNVLFAHFLADKAEKKKKKSKNWVMKASRYLILPTKEKNQVKKWARKGIKGSILPMKGCDRAF